MRDGTPISGAPHPPRHRDLWPVGCALTMAISTAITIVVALGVGAYLALGHPEFKATKTLSTESLFELVRLIFYVVAGLGGIVALVMTYRRQRYTERAQNFSEFDAAQRRMIDIYNSAIEQLGDDKAPVRLGALYALERIAYDYEEQRQTIVNVICAYLRMPFTPPSHLATNRHYQNDHQLPQSDETDDAHNELANRQELQVRITAQRIIVTHLTFTGHPRLVREYWNNIGVDLSDALLVDFDFSECRALLGNFTNARFLGFASFSESEFYGPAVFTGAHFYSIANFRDSTFYEDAQFREVTFHSFADFRRATFMRDTQYDAAQFFKSRFLGTADFRQARFETDALFKQAKFSDGPLFSNVRFAKRVIFEQIEYSDACTFHRSTIFNTEEQVAPPRGWEVIDNSERSGTRAFARLPDQTENSRQRRGAGRGNE